MIYNFKKIHKKSENEHKDLIDDKVSSISDIPHDSTDVIYLSN